MPRYDYECLNCGHVFELRQSFDADPEGVCPRCTGISKRKFHAVPIIYKGSGFYTTDYKNATHRDTSTEKKEEKDSKEKDSKEKNTPAKASADSSKDKSEAAKKET